MPSTPMKTAVAHVSQPWMNEAYLTFGPRKKRNLLCFDTEALKSKCEIREGASKDREYSGITYIVGAG